MLILEFRKTNEDETIYNSLRTLFAMALSLGRSRDVNGTIGFKVEIKKLKDELEHGVMDKESTDAKELIKELEEEVEEKDREIKRLRAG